MRENLVFFLYKKWTEKIFRFSFFWKLKKILFWEVFADDIRLSMGVEQRSLERMSMRPFDKPVINCKMTK